MEVFLEWFFRILPFVSLSVLGLGIFYRVSNWNRTPVPHRQTLYPAPTTAAAANFKIGKELILFETIFKSDKLLWIGSWIFHIGFAGALVGHLIGIPTLGTQFALVPGISVELSELLSELLGTTVGIMLLFGLIVLLIRRLSIREVKILSDPMDYLDLFFLLAIVITGNWMRFLSPMEYIDAKNFVISIITFSPMVIPSNVTFLIHFTIALLFFMYFPFSKLMHFLGSVYTRYISTKPGTGNYQTDQVRLENTSQNINKGV